MSAFIITVFLTQSLADGGMGSNDNYLANCCSQITCGADCREPVVGVVFSISAYMVLQHLQVSAPREEDAQPRLHIMEWVWVWVIHQKINYSNNYENHYENNYENHYKNHYDYRPLRKPSTKTTTRTTTKTTTKTSTITTTITTTKTTHHNTISDILIVNEASNSSELAIPLSVSFIGLMVLFVAGAYYNKRKNAVDVRDININTTITESDVDTTTYDEPVNYEEPVSTMYLEPVPLSQRGAANLVINPNYESGETEAEASFYEPVSQNNTIIDSEYEMATSVEGFYDFATATENKNP